MPGMLLAHKYFSLASSRKFFFIGDIMIHELEADNIVQHISFNAYTRWNGDVTSGYFPFAGTVIGGALSILGGM
jgi:hypothetical protein